MQESKRFRVDVALMVAANMLWPLGYSMYIGFFPLYIEQLGGTKFVVSVISSIPMFFGFLAILGGYIADRSDRKKLLLFGWAITVPAPFIWFFADQWQWLLAGQLIWSLTAVCIPALTLYIFDYDVKADKMNAFSLICLASIVGQIPAPMLGAAIVNRFNMSVLFLVVFACYFLSTVCCALISTQRPDRLKDVHRQAPDQQSWKRDFSKKTVFVMLFLAMLPFAQNFCEPYLALFLTETANFDVSRVGNAYTLLFAGAASFTWIFGKARKKINPLVLIGIGLSLFAASAFLLATSLSQNALYFGFFLRGANRSMLFFVQGLFASKLMVVNKGLVLSIFMAFRTVMIGLAAYPGVFLYGLAPTTPFVAEAVLVIVWLGILIAYRKGLFATFFQAK